MKSSGGVKITVEKPETFAEKKAVVPVRPSRKRFWWILGGGGTLLAAAIIGFIVFGGTTPDTTGNNSITPPAQKVARALDGVKVDPDKANPYPVAIMIENLITVRPQSGLDQANVVYEALAEGGITRFMAVYGITDTIDRIGPVRSARPYYLDWAHEYGALYGHVGGSPTALARINSENIFDLNQFFNAQYYVRDSSIGAPHNVFTDSEKLTFALRDKEAPAEGTFSPWKFTDGISLDARPTTGQTITIDYSTFNYKVEYTYNRDANTYDRSQAGEPFLSGGQRISPTNVIVQYVATGLEDSQRLTMTTVGTGDAVVFNNGVAIAATWRKPSLKERTRFYDATSGEELLLNRGQTWVQVVPTGTAVTY